MTQKNQLNMEEAFKEIREIFTAEYWAKEITKHMSEGSINPIQNFKFNIFKSKILIASAKEIMQVWPCIHQRLIEDEEHDDDTDMSSSLKSLSQFFGTGYASYLVYTEQALVTIVSATEVYFKDQLSYTIRKDPRILNRYSDREIKVQRIIDAGLNLTDEIGSLIVENINFQNLDDVKKEYKKVYGIDIFTEEELEELKKIFSIRHTIVHKAGIADHLFITHTGLNYKVGERICFERQEILEMINYIDNIITNIEIKINPRLTLKDFL